MQETIKCTNCKCKIDLKKVNSLENVIVINDEKYICNYFVCPKCSEVIIVTIDNELTYKVWEKLLKSNQKIYDCLENNYEVSYIVRKNNIKLRLKLNLLHEALYYKLIGQDYQMLDKDGNIIKSGILKLPNLNRRR